MLLKRIGALLLAMVLVVTTLNLGVFAAEDFVNVGVNQISTYGSLKTLKIKVYSTQEDADNDQNALKTHEQSFYGTIRVNLDIKTHLRSGENVYIIDKVYIGSNEHSIKYFNFSTVINGNTYIKVVLQKNNYYKLVNTSRTEQNRDYVGNTSKLLRVYFYNDNGAVLGQVDKYYNLDRYNYRIHPESTRVLDPAGYQIDEIKIKNYGSISSGEDADDNGYGTFMNASSISFPQGKDKIVLRVKCKPKTYSVSYNANLPAGMSLSEGSAPTSQTYNENAEVTIAGSNGMKLDGYEFKGWILNSPEGEVYANSKITVTGDIVFYAKWERKITQYSVSYNANLPAGMSLSEGSAPASQTYNEDAEVTIAGSNGMKLDGYEFKGWILNSPEGEVYANSKITVTGDIVFYAKWERKTTEEPDDDDEVFENVYVSNEYYLNNGLKFASGREYLTARRGNGTISFNVPSTSTHDGKTYQLKGIKLYEIINKAYRSFAIETEIPTDTTTSTGLETTTTGGTTGTLTSNGLELTTTGNPTDTLTSNGLELTTTGNPTDTLTSTGTEPTTTGDPTDTLTSTGTEPTATGDPTNSTTTSSTDSTFSAADTTQPSTNVDTEGSGDDSQETTTEGEPSTPEKLFDALAESSPPEELDLKYENGNVTAPFTLTFDYDEEKEYLVVIAYSLTEDDKGHTDYDDSDDSEPFSLGWDGTVVHLSDLGTLPKTGGSSKKMAGLSAIVLLTGAALKTLRFRRKGQNNGEGQSDDQE